MAARRLLAGNLSRLLVARRPLYSFPPTRARPFSTGSEPDRRPRWQAEFRRRLGIGDSPIIPDQISSKPRKDGQLNISFSAAIAEDHYDDVSDGDDEGRHDPSPCTGGVGAIARSSSGDLLGVLSGAVKYARGNKLELQLYALKAAANLAKELKAMGMHDGPVVYESSSYVTMVSALFHDECTGEPEEILRRGMPPDEDLEEVGRSCRIYCGTRDRLKEIMPAGLFDLVKE